MTFNQHQQYRAHLPGTSLPSSTALNHELKQRLRLISKNGGVHVGWVEDKPASPAPTDVIQLELDFNQSTTDYHWLKLMNNYSQSQSLLSQFSNHQLQQLRKAPTLEEKDQLITKFKLENAQAQEVQRQFDEVRESLERIRRPSSRFGSVEH